MLTHLEFAMHMAPSIVGPVLITDTSGYVPSEPVLFTLCTD